MAITVLTEYNHHHSIIFFYRQYYIREKPIELSILLRWFERIENYFHHWRRLVKNGGQNIGWANQNMGEAKGGKKW